MNNLDLLKNFSNITIKKIAEELNIDNSNVLSGRTTDKNYEIIKEKLLSKLAFLFMNELTKKEIEKYIYRLKSLLIDIELAGEYKEIEEYKNKMSKILEEMEINLCQK